MEGRAVAQVVRRSGRPLQQLIAAVEEIKEQLQDAYENLDERWYHGTCFVELMIKDGCFLMEMGSVFQHGESANKDFESDDPVFGDHGGLYLFNGIRADVVLIENQLPLLLLKKLMDVAYPDYFQSERQINNWVLFSLCSTVTYGMRVNYDHLGLHPLDVLHTSIKGTYCNHPECTTEAVMPSAAELHEAGIHFEMSTVKGFGWGVTFKDGVLKIPKIILYDNAERIFLNLMAFERLHPGSGNYVTAFVVFMDLLVDTAKDVALLRSKGIIKNGLGSDDMVADMINKALTKGAVMSPDSSLWNVLHGVNVHCKKPWNKWRANFLHNYLSNPWVFISLVAAFLLLFGTLMQTVYTVMPFYTNK
uniref:Uncharacterized protein n=1 Tax=Oryza brachyantha TaxID=4533 RepID=J3N8V0_ORYBR